MDRGSQKRRRARADGARGSVLMEAVLVLPLYLTMLGALFIMGDLARARTNLLAVERFVTWCGVQRYAAHSAEKVLAEVWKFVSRVSSVSVVTADRDGKTYGNHWGNCVMGYGVINVPMPYWMGMANAEQVVWQKNAAGHLTFMDDYYVPGADKPLIAWRAYLYRRFKVKDPLFARDRLEGRRLIGGLMWNIVGEPWPDWTPHELKAGTEPDEKRMEWLDRPRINDMISFGE